MNPAPISVALLVDHLVDSADAPRQPHRAPFVTGFEPLDSALGGGLRAEELTLVGGKPGVGKTVAALQWARNMTLDGATAVFVCYEHSARQLLARLLLLELGSLAPAASIREYDALRIGVQDFSWGYRSFADIPDERGLLADAIACLRAYSDRLYVVPASAARTGIEEITAFVDGHRGDRTALFVDYLQKIPVHPDPPTEAERVTRVAEALKDLALASGIMVASLSASTDDGLTAHRQRLHHLRGGTALAYEADVVIMLNEKTDAVSKVHLAYDGTRAETFQHQVVFGIEKNRSGSADLDMEFRKDFSHTRFDPHGGWVAERLVDERVFAE